MKTPRRSALASVLLLALCPGLALGDGPGSAGAVITTQFSGPVQVNSPVAGQVLVFSASGGWSNAASPAPTSAGFDSLFGSTQGSVIYRNATTWVALGPGTSGQVLSTGGAGANPSWATVSSTHTWAQTLSDGNVSGAFSPIVNAGQGLGMIGATPGANQIKFGTGAGSIIHILGPTDQDLAIDTGVGTKNLQLLSEGGAVKIGTAGNFRLVVASSGTTTLTPPADTAALVITGGTTTVNAPPLSATQVWNAGGVTFKGVSLDVTNTASAAGSRLLDLLVASTTKFSVNVNGTLYSNGVFVPNTGSSFQFYESTGVSGGAVFTGGVVASADGFAGTAVTSGVIVGDTGGNGFYGFYNTSNVCDATFSRNAAGVLQFGTGTTRNASGSLLATGGKFSGGLGVNGTSGTPASGNSVFNNTGAVLAQNATDGFVYVPVVNTGAPSGTPTAFTGASAVCVQGTSLYFYSGGAWNALAAGGTPTLGAVVNAGNSVNSVAASGRLTWGSGGTYAAGSTSQIYGNTDGTFFISAGTPTSGDGKGITFTASDAFATSLGSGGSISLVGGRGDANGSVGGNAASITLTGGGISSGGLLSLSGGAALVGANNVDPGSVTVSSGLPTGTGSGYVKITTGFVGASGSTAQTLYDRLLVTSKTFAGSTTSATADLYLVASNAVSNSGICVMIDFMIEVADGSNHVSTISGVQIVSASNRNGTVTASSSTFTNLTNGDVSDTTTFTTLTTTTTATVSGTNVQIKVTPSWAAGTPTSVKITYQARANGQCTLTPQ